MAIRYLIPRGTHGTVESPHGSEPYSLTLKRDFQSTEPPTLDRNNAIFISSAGWKLTVARGDVIVSNEDGTNSYGV
jgi:hypothetical protein